MEELENEVMVTENQTNSLMDIENDNLMAMAEIAEKRVDALKKIITASLSMTTEYDWTIIGGKPYLQESGATKVARLFGVSWTIDKPEIIVDNKGYKTYIFKGIFSMGNQSIEAEGSRSMRDDFFSKNKTLDEIDERDVRMSAYTNCINNGIKRICSGLRNITVDSLKEANLDVDKINGYTFNKGSKGGTTKPAGTGFVCECCGESITQTVSDYSKKNLGKALCMKCQKKQKEDALKDVPNQTADDLFPQEA